MSKLTKYGFWGLVLLVTSIVTMMLPTAPLGADIWKIIPFYLFIISALVAPFVLKKAKKSGDRLAGYAYYLSWIPFVLCLFFLITLGVYR